MHKRVNADEKYPAAPMRQRLSTAQSLLYNLPYDRTHVTELCVALALRYECYEERTWRKTAFMRSQ
jgi:hypothetical protein